MKRAKVQLPPKLVDVFLPSRGDLRYRGAYGGRGSGKSFSFALMACVFGYAEKLRVLCVREFQNSIKDSFHAEIKNAIESTPWLAANYTVGVDYIRGNNGTEFIFKGLRNNTHSVKSLSQIDICIIEEAEALSEQAYLILEPTIRAPKSEIWVIWNREKEESPTDMRFIKNKPERSRIVEVNYDDNPWFPSELEEQRKRAQQILDPNTYAHIWEGAYLKHSKAQIFAGKYEVKEFEAPASTTFYQGVDYGFSQDPTFATRSFILDDCLYISHEAVKRQLELDDTATFINSIIPNFEDWASYGDSSRPETTSYLQRHGLPLIENVKKWKGSVEDGIEYLKSFRKIYIHPRCTELIKEARLYSYKVDRMTGDILPIIEDAFNHGWDSVRYGHSKLIQNKNSGLLDYL